MENTGNKSTTVLLNDIEYDMFFNMIASKACLDMSYFAMLACFHFLKVSL